MSEVQFKKHRVFRETESVVFYDISVDGSNAQDLVCHTGAAISPPDDIVGSKTILYSLPPDRSQSCFVWYSHI